MDQQEFSTEETIKELKAIKEALIKDIKTYTNRIDEIISNLDKRTDDKNN